MSRSMEDAAVLFMEKIQKVTKKERNEDENHIAASWRDRLELGKAAAGKTGY